MIDAITGMVITMVDQQDQLTVEVTTSIVKINLKPTQLPYYQLTFTPNDLVTN